MNPLGLTTKKRGQVYNMAGQGPEHIFKLLFFKVYLFLRERESAHEEGRDRDRERETLNLKQAPGSKLSA